MRVLTSTFFNMLSVFIRFCVSSVTTFFSFFLPQSLSSFGILVSKSATEALLSGHFFDFCGVGLCCVVCYDF